MATALGAIVQGASGVGGGFISIPLIAVIDYALLPGPQVFASLSISTLMAWRERNHIDYQNTGSLLALMVPGAVVGAWLLSLVSVDRLGVLFGSIILLAVIVSLLGLQLVRNPRNAAVSGFVAGIMGASTGIGAPPIALLYQRASGPMVRSTLAYIYTAASLLILCALAFFGRFGVNEMLLGVMLVPGWLLGYLCSRPLARFFDHGATRYVVLGVSGAAAVSLIVTSF